MTLSVRTEKDLKNTYYLDTYTTSSLSLTTCFLHLEGTSTLQTFPLGKLPVSKCFHTSGSSVVDMLKGQSGYVVLPIYLNDNGEICDYQLAVTGSCLPSENDTQASIRENHEEIGFNVLSSYISNKRKVAGNKRSVSVFAKVIKPTNFAPAPPPIISDENDDKTRKILTWLIIDNPTDIFNRTRTASTDKAGKAVAILSVSDTIKLIQHFF
jgi:hypothetical protein